MPVYTVHVYVEYVRGVVLSCISLTEEWYLRWIAYAVVMLKQKFSARLFAFLMSIRLTI